VRPASVGIASGVAIGGRQGREDLDDSLAAAQVRQHRQRDRGGHAPQREPAWAHHHIAASHRHTEYLGVDPAVAGDEHGAALPQRAAAGTAMSSVAELVGEDCLSVCHTNACILCRQEEFLSAI